MKTLVRGAASLAFVMFVVSCSGLLKKKAEEDAGLEASVVTEVVVDAAPAPVPVALATNEGDVARFPDETKLADVAATLLRPYNVREAPPAGTVIVSLPKGASVTQIAQRSVSYLIVFDNPKAPGTKLMGWIHREAFSAVVQDAGPLVCPQGEIALFGDTPFCGKLCSDDKGCPTGQACKGQANKLLPTGKAGDVVTVCTVFHPHDAGAPTPPKPVDAGPAPVVDAGKAPVVDAGKVVVDAGTAPTGPAQDVVAPTGGKCPANFVLVNKTNKCHRLCTTSMANTECRNKPYYCVRCDKDTKQVCVDTRDQCK
ncbi:MAG: hypothetical protein K0S65_523 [Labilithrix sp.]|nr:hypothetical protein [Labilithrix sp.]